MIDSPRSGASAVADASICRAQFVRVTTARQIRRARGPLPGRASKNGGLTWYLAAISLKTCTDKRRSRKIPDRQNCTEFRKHIHEHNRKKHFFGMLFEAGIVEKTTISFLFYHYYYLFSRSHKPLITSTRCIVRYRPVNGLLCDDLFL